MTEVKKGMNNIGVAMCLLMASIAQFDIKAVLKEFLGWTPPSWLLKVLAVLGVAAAIISIVASHGVLLPKWLAVTVAYLSLASQ